MVLNLTGYADNEGKRRIYEIGAVVADQWRRNGTAQYVTFLRVEAEWIEFKKGREEYVPQYKVVIENFPEHSFTQTVNILLYVCED
jgi:hypothetical protein